MLLLFDILSTAAILFLVALGLLAIFGVLKIINFAHGAWLTVGAYCAVLTARLGLNPWAAVPIAFVVASGPFPAAQTDYVYLLMPVRLPG